MTSLQTMRRFGPWLLGLFLIAQIAGVVPLISAHTLHVYESKQVVADGHGIIAVGPNGAHNHGIADLNDQCCAFHHLAGVLPNPLLADPGGFTKTAIVALFTKALVTADPVLPERPPKPLMSV